MDTAYEIRPINAWEWLPDRCMPIEEPLDLRGLAPRYGCPGLLSGGARIRNRAEFEEFYRNVLDRFVCCGFVAWEGDRIIGYTNFFPREIARQIKFYGWGEAEGERPDTLIHHCISIVRNPNWRRRGIGTGLVRHSLEWAQAHRWKRYEVHRVLPDLDKGATNEQKAVLSFWRKFGFSIIGEEEADDETRRYYGADRRYSLALDMDAYQGTMS